MGLILYPYRFRSLGGLITGGTNIGNATINGGLAAAFDGTTNQDSSVAAISASASGYVGKTISKRVFSATVYGCNDRGYVVSADPSVTITLYGKTGAAPANGTDGTALGSVTFTDTANESGNPRSMTSSDTETLWDHTWVDVVSSGTSIAIAEVQIYESV
jgi:hypothetical protein